MVNKCSVVGCFTNYEGYEKGTVFPLPEDKEQRQQWIKFLHRQDSYYIKHVFICYKHFAEDRIAKTPKRVKLLHNLKPVPTIIPKSQETVNLPPTAVFETIKTPRKPAKERIFRDDELQAFKAKDEIKSINDITDKKVRGLGQDFQINRQQDHVTIYCLENNSDALPQITFCVKIQHTLSVKLFHKGLGFSLWFRKGRNTRLTSWSMVPNFIVHMRQKVKESKSLLDELEDLKFKGRPQYSSHMIRYALELRYTSLQAYNILLRELNLPSVSFLRSLTSGELYIHVLNL